MEKTHNKTYKRIGDCLRVSGFRTTDTYEDTLQKATCSFDDAAQADADELMIPYEDLEVTAETLGVNYDINGASHEYCKKHRFAISKALTYMHGRDPRVIHHDIKPSNIMVTGSHHDYVCDLGLARLQDVLATIKSSKGCGAGTVPYKAPEMFYDGKDQHPADTTYQMKTTRRAENCIIIALTRI
ncbi:hypothetical protein EMCRGX_G017801 [Ephydatia muelleri]